MKEVNDLPMVKLKVGAAAWFCASCRCFKTGDNLVALSSKR